MKNIEFSMNFELSMILIFGRGARLVRLVAIIGYTRGVVPLILHVCAFICCARSHLEHAPTPLTLYNPYGSGILYVMISYI